MMIEHSGISIWIILLLLLNFGRTDAQSNCTGHESQGTGHTCYTYNNARVTWSEAKQQCRLQGGHLAAFVEALDQDVVRYLLPGSSTPAGTTGAWIGAYHTKGNWTWVENNELLGPQGCYADRREQRDWDIEYNMTLADVTPYTCMAACSSVTRPIPFQYAAVQGGQQCFCGNTFGRYGTETGCTIKCTSDANFYCGGMLMNFVYKINGAYGWWAYAQPNNHRGNQDCGIIDTSHDAKMADESCYQNRAYMCEITTTNCPTGSPYHYYHSNTRRCFYLNETKVTWYTARRECQLLSNPGPGRLVTIDSPETHTIIRDVTLNILPVAEKIWIGLYKGVGWQWSTGANFNYTKWAAPSLKTGNPISVNTCGLINTTLGKSWTDASCMEQLPYICQFGGTSVPNPTEGPYTTTPTGDPPVNSPTAGASTNNTDGLSTLELVLAIVMSLLGLMLLILMIYCLVMLCQKRNNKINYMYDARPIAPVPNSGMAAIADYDKYSDRSYSSADSTTELHRPGGPW